MSSGVFDETYKRVKIAHSNIVFEKIDYEQNKNMANKYGVNSFPSIIAVDSNGKKISEFKGDRNNPQVLERFAAGAASHSK
jgi:thioredoxin-related protein